MHSKGPTYTGHVECSSLTPLAMGPASDYPTSVCVSFLPYELGVRRECPVRGVDRKDVRIQNATSSKLLKQKSSEANGRIIIIIIG